MAYSKKEREEYNRHRERTSKELGLDKNKYNTLRRVANELTEHGTSYANGRDRIGKSYGEKEYKKGVGKAFSKTKAIRKKMKDLHFHHQTDPRGASLYAAKERLNDRNYSSKGRVIY